MKRRSQSSIPSQIPMQLKASQTQCCSHRVEAQVFRPWDSQECPLLHSVCNLAKAVLCHPVGEACRSLLLARTVVLRICRSLLLHRGSLPTSNLHFLRQAQISHRRNRDPKVPARLLVQALLPVRPKVLQEITTLVLHQVLDLTDAKSTGKITIIARQKKRNANAQSPTFGNPQCDEPSMNSSRMPPVQIVLLDIAVTHATYLHRKMHLPKTIVMHFLTGHSILACVATLIMSRR